MVSGRVKLVRQCVEWNRRYGLDPPRLQGSQRFNPIKFFGMESGVLQKIRLLAITCGYKDFHLLEILRQYSWLLRENSYPSGVRPEEHHETLLRHAMVEVRRQLASYIGASSSDLYTNGIFCRALTEGSIRES